ncbi:hypothetical protein LTR56_020332 [Elasticomyces elasticus]|nr:hypothetical protein LTR56_020332 [Elasticomyces elasticus]KAK3655611.1 hypothetical protein LTR22_010201 [Elasticomyces elasticus]KAK4910269.1 hypothetical protein LTR49_021015 [Elasticomyces elasticus]KAK5764842.1 hypothetical protein LTS12_005112 [Elasticomyces elasticus]
MRSVASRICFLCGVIIVKFYRLGLLKINEYTARRFVQARALFYYRPLADPSKQIRLLKLEPVRGKADKISVSLWTWDLDTAPAYVAISYTWGSERSTHRICVNDDRFCVRKNCLIALQECQSNAVTSYIWIDALCINQDDVAEKSHQVAMMGTIFGQAMQTYISFGSWNIASLDQRSDMAECRACFRAVVEDLDQLGIPDWERGDPPRPSELAIRRQKSLSSYAFDELKEARYWTRLWVLQELFLSARVAFFYPGGAPIDLRCLVKSCQHPFPRGETKEQWEEFDLFRSEVVGDAWEYAQRSPLQSILQRLYPGLEMMTEVVPIPRRSGQYKARWDVVVADFRECECEDPRDKIYGLLPFMQWSTGMPPLRPDYSKTRMELAVQLMGYCVVRDTWTVDFFLETREARLVLGALEVSHDEFRSSVTSRYSTAAKRMVFELL